MATRSTSEWYSVANSIGLYPVGVGEGGLRSTYAGNLRSRGLGMLAVSRPLGLRTRAQGWNYHADNLFNTIFMEVTTGRAVGEGQFTLGGPVPLPAHGGQRRQRRPGRLQSRVPARQ